MTLRGTAARHPTLRHRSCVRTGDLQPAGPVTRSATRGRTTTCPCPSIVLQTPVPGNLVVSRSPIGTRYSTSRRNEPTHDSTTTTERVLPAPLPYSHRPPW